MGQRFQTTNWSLIVAAAGKSPAAREALANLCEAYWNPLYAYVRSRGNDPDQARDLTQSYFLQFLDKDFLKDVDPEHGRFRSFMLASLNHFISKERDKASALKRGGGAVKLRVDSETAERLYSAELASSLTPEQLFEKRWALEVQRRALARLHDECEGTGKRQQFDAFRPYLTGEDDRPYRQIAELLEMTEAAVKVAVHRFRRRFGQLLRVEIEQTVTDPREVDNEIRHLLSVVGSR